MDVFTRGQAVGGGGNRSAAALGGEADVVVHELAPLHQHLGVDVCLGRRGAAHYPTADPRDLSPWGGGSREELVISSAHRGEVM